MKKVIIVGCGAAGIACARTLKGQSNLEILVLEGRDRVSGRCVTSKFGTKKKYDIDIGACWIEGVKNNPLTDLCGEHGFIIVGGKGGRSTYDFDGEVINKGIYVKANNKWYDYYKEARREGRNLSKKDADCSLRSLMDKIIEEEGVYYSEAEERYKNFIESGTEQFNGGTMEEFSAKKFGTGPGFKGGEGYVREGIGALLEKEFRKLKVPIEFNTRIVKINYANKNKVILESSTGKVYECDYCVCTVPLGVLKHKLIEFTPKFSEKRNHCIKSLGFGIMNKLVLVFDKKFWSDKNSAGFGYCDDEVKGRWRFWSSLSKWHNNDKNCAILVSLMTCEFAKSLEKLGPKEVVQDAMKVLRKIFSKNQNINNIPDPVDFHVSYWGKDPFTMGGYSFLGVNSSTASCIQLGTEINNLHFAGEHTSEYYSAVHGAWLSGIREGKKIIGKL